MGMQSKASMDEEMRARVIEYVFIFSSLRYIQGVPRDNAFERMKEVLTMFFAIFSHFVISAFPQDLH
jgi:hypothetical protein